MKTKKEKFHTFQQNYTISSKVIGSSDQDSKGVKALQEIPQILPLKLQRYIFSCNNLISAICGLIYLINACINYRIFHFMYFVEIIML